MNSPLTESSLFTDYNEISDSFIIFLRSVFKFYFIRNYSPCPPLIFTNLGSFNESFSLIFSLLTGVTADDFLIPLKADYKGGSSSI